MICFKCDQCEKLLRMAEPPITIKGYTGRRSGILLPERLQEHHFCGNECFEAWMVVGLPKSEEVGP